MSVSLKAGMAFGKYRLERPLGRGGMASVWLAKHTLLETPFAVKVLDPAIAGKDPRYVERFLREARLASRLHHPHLVGVYDVGQDPATGLYYLVMEYVPGGNVSQLLAKEGPLPERAALDIVRQVAEALGQAERLGMVHRDIKPDNIMFGERGEAKLSDLGIAKAELGDEAHLTQTAAVFGTPAYMSPEQATDAGKVDARADIYSLGVVCYEMLTGQRPYGGKTVVEILSRIVDKAPPPDVRTLRPGVSRATAELVREMMDKARDRRPASADALLERLARMGEAVGATPSDAGQTMPTMAVSPSATLPTQAVAKTPTAPSPPPPATKAPPRPHGKRPLVWGVAGMTLALGALFAALLFNGAKAPSTPPPHQPTTETAPPKTKPAPTPKVKPGPKPVAKTESKPEVKHEPEAKPTPEPEVKPVAKPEPEAKPEVKLEPKPEPEVKPEEMPKPKLEPAPAVAPPPRARPIALHLLLGTREVTQAEVAVIAEGRPLNFAKGPYVFALPQGQGFEVSVARGREGALCWRAVESRHMAADASDVTLRLEREPAPEPVRPSRIQGLRVVENGKPKALVVGSFRKFGGKTLPFGPCSPEELADFLRRNAPGDGAYWLSIVRADGAEARFCPSKTPRREGDAQPYHAGMLLDLTREAVQLYEHSAN